MSAGAITAKGALAAPLVFLGVAFATWGSAQASPAIWAVSLALFGVALLPGWSKRWSVTPLAVAIWAYAGWTVFHTAFVSRVYNPTGLFDPLFLVAGFGFARVIDREKRERCYYAIAIVVAALAIWGTGQLAFGAQRGHALFETGNTLASVVNAILAPALLAVLYGARGRLELLAAILLAGLWATFSRGGAIALVVTSVVMTAFIGWDAFDRGRLARVVLLVLVGGAVVAAAIVLSRWLPQSADQTVLFANLDSVKSRLELYRLAWSTLDFGSGIGYLAFRYVLEVGRAVVPSYGASSFTYFVHDDYLQTLLELGIPGFAALLAVMVIALRAARLQSHSTDVSRMESLGALASVLTLCVHALVDFPLHVPLCLFLFGFGLGILDRGSRVDSSQAPAGQVQRLITLVLAIGVTVLLVRPVIAENAAAYAMKKWLLGQTRDAAYGFELARRADPRDWRYHLYAGQFWFAQAAENGEPEQARLADAAFAAGMAANPLEPSSALGRAFTRLRYGSILPAPEPMSAVRAWADQAILVAPLNPAVRREYDEILRRLPAQK